MLQQVHLTISGIHYSTTQVHLTIIIVQLVGGVAQW